MINGLQSITDDIAAYKELFLQEAEIVEGAGEVIGGGIGGCYDGRLNVCDLG